MMASNCKKFVSEDEEIRCGFKVSSNRKKVWSVELGILEEFKKICQKHNLRYYADCGTLLGAIRHKGFIPWDDDMDVVMSREDFDKFGEIASKELQPPYELLKGYQGIFRLINAKTTCLSDYNWRDKDFKGGICLDIFPMDSASKYKIINRFKYKILYLIEIILLRQKAYWHLDKGKGWKKYVSKVLYFTFKNVNYNKLQKIQDNVNKKTLFKGNEVYHGYNKYLFFPKDIYKKSHDVEYENTTICIPDGYHEFLKRMYGNYMKPVINLGGHNRRYSVDQPYKEIIKTFDKNKSNEENYKGCKDLFVL